MNKIDCAIKLPNYLIFKINLSLMNFKARKYICITLLQTEIMEKQQKYYTLQSNMKNVYFQTHSS